MEKSSSTWITLHLNSPATEGITRIHLEPYGADLEGTCPMKSRKQLIMLMPSTSGDCMEFARGLEAVVDHLRQIARSLPVDDGTPGDKTDPDLETTPPSIQ